MRLVLEITQTILLSPFLEVPVGRYSIWTIPLVTIHLIRRIGPKAGTPWKQSANSAWIQGVFAAANSAGLPIRDTVNVEGCDSAQYQATVLFNDTTFTDSLLTVDGCDSIVTYNYTINPSPSIILTVDNTISCFASNDGQISATLLTGNYDWTGTLGFSQSSTNNVINNLGPDTYALVFTDDNGCGDQDSIILNEPLEIRTVSVLSACDSALVHGNWVFTPGNYIDTQ